MRSGGPGCYRNGESLGTQLRDARKDDSREHPAIISTRQVRAGHADRYRGIRLFFLEGDNSREESIALWEKVISQTGLKIHEREEVTDIRREADCLVVKTERGNVFKARSVVLAIGVRGNPRHLGLPGETSSRVVYNLIEPGEYRGKKILVVGGGNAGAEIVQALAAPEFGNTVSYSFRAPVLTNVTRENAEKISALLQSKRVMIYPSSALKEIRPATVVLEAVKGKSTADSATSSSPSLPPELDNDVIFAMIGDRVTDQLSEVVRGQDGHQGTLASLKSLPIRRGRNLPCRT